MGDRHDDRPGAGYALRSYRASLNYSVPGMRVDFVLTRPDG